MGIGSRRFRQCPSPNLSEKVSLLFRRFRASEFLEARIIPKLIEHRIEPEQRGSKRHSKREYARIRYRKQFLQSSYSTVGFAHLRGYPGKSLNCARAF